MVYSKLCPFHKNKLLSLSLFLALFVFLALFFFLSATLATLFPRGNMRCQLSGLTSGASCWARSASPPLRPPPPHPRSHCHWAGHYPPPQLRRAGWHSLPPSCQSPFHLNKIKHKCGVGAHTLAGLGVEGMLQSTNLFHGQSLEVRERMGNRAGSGALMVIFFTWLVIRWPHSSLLPTIDSAPFKEIKRHWSRVTWKHLKEERNSSQDERWHFSGYWLHTPTFRHSVSLFLFNKLKVVTFITKQHIFIVQQVAM